MQEKVGEAPATGELFVGMRGVESGNPCSKFAATVDLNHKSDILAARPLIRAFRTFSRKREKGLWASTARQLPR
jgi:hypothetical protein